MRLRRAHLLGFLCLAHTSNVAECELYPGCGMVVPEREGLTCIELYLLFYQCVRQHQFPLLPVPCRHLQHTFGDLL